MGFGAYLAALTDRQRYDSEEARERCQILEKPLEEQQEIHKILGAYGVRREVSQMVIDQLKQDPEQWIKVCTYR